MISRSMRKVLLSLVLSIMFMLVFVPVSISEQVRWAFDEDAGFKTRHDVTDENFKRSISDGDFFGFTNYGKSDADDVKVIECNRVKWAINEKPWPTARAITPEKKKVGRLHSLKRAFPGQVALDVWGWSGTISYNWRAAVIRLETYPWTEIY